MPRTGRPPKLPEDRRTESMKIPLSVGELEIIKKAAEISRSKPTTWVRDTLIRAAKRKKK